MTAQVPDLILFEGRWMDLECEPLASWLDRRKNRQLRFRARTTACWRGYQARWKVDRGRLYLTRFSARLRNGRFAGLPTLFENYSAEFYAQNGANDPANQGPGRFAFWVTGIVRCSIGRLRHYVHAGYESIYEAELQLVFDRGFLVGQRIVWHDDIETPWEETDEWDDLEDEP